LDTAFLSNLLWLRGLHCSSYGHWKARSGLPIRLNWTLAAEWIWTDTYTNYN